MPKPSAARDQQLHGPLAETPDGDINERSE